METCSFTTDWLSPSVLRFSAWKKSRRLSSAVRRISKKARRNGVLVLRQWNKEKRRKLRNEKGILKHARARPMVWSRRQMSKQRLKLGDVTRKKPCRRIVRDDQDLKARLAEELRDKANF